MVSGSPQRLLGAGGSSVCRRCSRPGTMPGCLFDQAAGALTKLRTASRKKNNTQRQLDDMTVMKMATFWGDV